MSDTPTIDPRKAIMQGDAGFDTRWQEWLQEEDARDCNEADLISAKALARKWWHAGVVRGVVLMTPKEMR